MFSKKRGLNRKAGPPVHDDLVNCQFTAQERNQVELTDITEHRTVKGKLNVCAIKDLYSNRIVGYSIDSRVKASLAVAGLRNAVEQRDPVGTIVHSDRGRNPGHASSYMQCPTIDCKAQLDGSGRAEIMLPWSRSSPYCRRAFSTVSVGPLGSSYV